MTTTIDAPGLAKISASNLARDLNNERQRKLRRSQEARARRAVKHVGLKAAQVTDAEQLIAITEALAAEIRRDPAAVVELEMMLRKLPAAGEPGKSPTIDRSPSS